MLQLLLLLVLLSYCCFILISIKLFICLLLLFRFSAYPSLALCSLLFLILCLWGVHCSSVLHSLIHLIPYLQGSARTTVPLTLLNTTPSEPKRFIFCKHLATNFFVAVFVYYCQSRNSPWFNPNNLRGAADEAVWINITVPRTKKNNFISNPLCFLHFLLV